MKIGDYSFDFFYISKKEEQKDFLNFLSNQLSLRDSTFLFLKLNKVGVVSAKKYYMFNKFGELDRSFSFILEGQYFLYKYWYFIDYELSKFLTKRARLFLYFLARNPLRKSKELGFLIDRSAGGVRSYFKFILDKYKKKKPESVLLERFFFVLANSVFGSRSSERFKVLRNERS
jgi:hypothetical protein